MPKVLTEEHKAAMAKGRAEYWQQRRASKLKSMAPSKKPVVSRQENFVQQDVVVRKPYVFATVNVVTSDHKVLTGHGFAKWDNNPSPAWNEDLGKTIAIGRAKKEIKEKHGLKIK